jgi:hypothetical protein
MARRIGARANLALILDPPCTQLCRRAGLSDHLILSRLSRADGQFLQTLLSLQDIEA